ncbi:hypothetical protein AGMMS49975_10960 [Clostridia bacterium]|nr:hypothetical protein AGMMS49975_10960 [Clostridia bacterium]
MHLVLLQRYLREICKKKSTLFYMFCFSVFMALFTYIKYGETALWLIWYCVSFAASFTAESFAGEKEERTIETLLTLPLDLRTIVSARVLFAVSVCFAAEMVYLITLLFAGAELSAYFFAAAFLLVPACLFAFCYLMVYFSYRSSNVRMVHMKSAPLVIFHIIPVVVCLALSSYAALFCALALFGIEFLCVRSRFKKVFSAEFLIS